MIPLLAGGTVVTLTSRSLDAGELWRAAVDERATMIVIVGDAFAKPMIRALDAAIESGQPYDLSNVRMIISSGVMWTAEVKEALLDRAEHLMLIDAMGSTEGGMGNQVTMRGLPVQTAKFTAQPETKLFSEDGRRIEPGLGRDGHGGSGRQRPPRLLQGSREVGEHVQGHRRRALLVPRRLGLHRGRRHAHPPRARQSVHQHRRREGVPRGGRGGSEAAPRYRGLPRGRRARREVRRADRRRRRARCRAAPRTKAS